MALIAWEVSRGCQGWCQGNLGGVRETPGLLGQLAYAVVMARRHIGV